MVQTKRLLLSLFFGVLFSPVFVATLSAQEGVGELFRCAQVHGGVVLHLNAGNGETTAALYRGSSFIVYGLERDGRKVEAANRVLFEKELLGRVSVELWKGIGLPFIDNTVNLVVAKEPLPVPMEEAMRVIAPGGVLCIEKEGKWVAKKKAVPGEMDEWTHYLHGPDGNVVSHDKLVDLPRRFQWAAAPKWARHHDRMGSMSALVSSGGRIFYIIDEGVTASVMLPSKWALICRDAFNGKLLWKRPIPKWWPRLWPFKSGPTFLARRLVAIGDKLFATLGLDAPLSMIDGATGRVLRTFEGTKGTDEILYYKGVLYLAVRKKPREMSSFLPKFRNVGQEKIRVAKEWPWRDDQVFITALDPATSKILWRVKDKSLPLSLAVGDTGLFHHDGSTILKRDKKTGALLWRSKEISRRSLIPANFGPTLVLYKDLVLFSGGDRKMWGLSAKDGKILWSQPHPRSGHNSPEDLIVAGGLVWSGKIAASRDKGLFTGRDPYTGEVKETFKSDVDIYWFHHRCYRSKATDRFLLTSRTGVEFIDIQKKHLTPNHWVRGGCIYGIMPCNGLLYAPPHDCACYAQTKLYGFCALAPRQTVNAVSDVERLEKGPAFGKEAALLEITSEDWPTYRHDNARSGKAGTRLESPKMKVAWKAFAGKRLSTPVEAGGRVFVSLIDDHVIKAFSLSNGKELWAFVTGGRVDSPPTVYKGLLVFGCADGNAYCLRASDGILAWKYLVAPNRRKMISFEQVESVWPLHGSVLVRDGVAWCLAGRSAFLDGGLRLVGLNVETGSKRFESVVDDKDPGEGKNLQEFVRVLNMPPGLPDVLSESGGLVYMRSQGFNAEGKRIPAVSPPPEPTRWVANQAGQGAHLFCPTGFLDGSWFHRGYWVFGRHWSSGCNWWWRAGRYTPAGRILVVGDDTVYGYGRMPDYFKWSTPLQYHLFAAKAEVKPAKTSSKSKITYAQVPNTRSLNPARKPLTVEAWFKTAAKGGVIVARGGPSFGYALVMTRGAPAFIIRSEGKVYSVRAGKFGSRRWNHVAGVLTRDGLLSIYLNGREARRKKGVPLIAGVPIQPLEVGADLKGAVGTYRSPFSFKGSIDQVCLYRRALTAAEIAEHYEKPQKAGAGDSALVLALGFDNGDGSDSSGHGNNAKIVGAIKVKGRVGTGLRFLGGGGGKKGTPFMVDYRWTGRIPLHGRAMVLAGDNLFVAGPPALVDEEKAFDNMDDPKIKSALKAEAESFTGKRGGVLTIFSSSDGKGLGNYLLSSPPVWDGMIAARGSIVFSSMDGNIYCLRPEKKE